MEQNNNSKHSDYFNRKIIETGIVSGLLFLLFNWMSYSLGFSKWNFFSAFSVLRWPVSVKYGLAFLLPIMVSILLTLLYNVWPSKEKPFLTGIAGAVLLFFIVFFFISHEPLNLVTMFSLLLGYCLFISTTISWVHEQGK